VDAVSDISRNCWLSCTSVDDTLVSVDWDFDTFRIESAPVFLHQIDNTRTDIIGYVATDVDIFVKVRIVSFLVEFYLDEIGSAVIVR
jgi:hypothetical protein